MKVVSTTQSEIDTDRHSNSTKKILQNINIWIYSFTMLIWLHIMDLVTPY